MHRGQLGDAHSSIPHLTNCSNDCDPTLLRFSLRPALASSIISRAVRETIQKSPEFRSNTTVCSSESSQFGVASKSRPDRTRNTQLPSILEASKQTSRCPCRVVRRSSKRSRQTSQKCTLRYHRPTIRRSRTCSDQTGTIFLHHTLGATSLGFDQLELDSRSKRLH